MCCKSVTLLIEKSKMTPLSIKEMISLKIHLAMCSPCSDYNKLSKQFDQLFENSTNEVEENFILSEDKKKAILDLLEKHNT